ncbi:MAG: amidohydrolase family protein [Bacillota bacterium]|nr:amidohydrolase family protein [Bacillota bacterium]
MKTADTVIANGIILTMEGRGAGIINDGAVAIKGTDIAAVGSTKDVLREYSADRVINAHNKAVLPGFIDCHAHSSDAIARGMAQDITGWMYKGIWPVLSCADEEAIKAGSMIHLAESVQNGTTTVCDMVNGIVPVIENHVSLGVRSFISEMVHELPADIYKCDPLAPIDFDHSVGNAKFRNCVKMTEKYHGYDSGRINCMVGPQAINMCSVEMMDTLYDYARKNKLGVTIHVAQSDRENIQVEKRYGKRAIPLLKEHGFLGEDVLGIHLTCATLGELKTMVDSGCPMVLCSNSIAIIGGEMPPASEYLELGGIVGMGTDQAPGNNRNNMFQEMKNGSLLNKCKHKNGTVFPAWQMLRMATIDGARALRRENEIGSLRAGKKADIIIVDLEYPALTPIIRGPIRNIVPNLVYSANGSEVETVIINGKFVVEDHKLLTVDLKKAIDRANEAADRFSEKLYRFQGLNDLPLAKWTSEGLY